MPWWKQFLYRYGNYLLAIISPILFLILLEGSFWLIPSKKTVDLSPLFLLNPFWEQHNLFQSDPYLFWTFRPNQVIYTAFDLNKEHQIPINSLGLRGLEYNAADYKDSYRILCLGDSCTFCWEVVFRDGYPEILQRDLRITYPDKNVRVINAGVPGYASFQMVRMYRKWNTFFKPDLIVFWSASNDAADAYMYPDKENALHQNNNYTLRKWLNKSRAYFILSGLYKYNRYKSLSEAEIARIARDGHILRVSMDDFRANLTELAFLTKKNNQKLIFLTRHAYRSNIPILKEYNAIIKEVGQAQSVPVVDIAAKLTGPQNAQYYNSPPKDDVHLKWKGCYLVASEVAATIIKNKYIH